MSRVGKKFGSSHLSQKQLVKHLEQYVPVPTMSEDSEVKTRWHRNQATEVQRLTIFTIQDDVCNFNWALEAEPGQTAKDAKRSHWEMLKGTHGHTWEAKKKNRSGTFTPLPSVRQVYTDPLWHNAKNASCIPDSHRPKELQSSKKITLKAESGKNTYVNKCNRCTQTIVDMDLSISKK